MAATSNGVACRRTTPHNVSMILSVKHKASVGFIFQDSRGMRRWVQEGSLVIFWNLNMKFDVRFWRFDCYRLQCEKKRLPLKQMLVVDSRKEKKVYFLGFSKKV